MTKTFLTILFIFGIGVLGFFYLKPAWDNFNNIRAEIGDLQSTSQELESLIANRDALIDSINRISKDDLDRINQALPQGQQSAQLLIFFENISGKSGLVLKTIDVSNKDNAAAGVTAASAGQPKPGGSIVAPKTVSIIQEFPINMNLIGTYDSFKKFLSGLENNLRVIDLKTITFGSAGSSGVLNFSIVGKTYYQ